MEISCDLTHKKGFLIFSSILLDANSCLYERKKLSLLLEKKGISALVTTKVASSVIEGMRSLIDNIGLGTLSPNTIVAGASEKEEKIPFIAEMILFVYRSQKNLVLIKESSTTQSLRTSKTIHVWWGAQNRINSELMIIFCHMLKKSFSWKSAKIVLKTVVKNAEEVASMQKKLINFMDESRVFFDTSVILHQHGDVFTKTIQEHAAGADLVFLGLRAPESNETIENYAKYYKSLMEKTQEFPAVAFILAGEPLDFKKILF